MPAATFGRIQGLPNILKYPLLSGKATDFKFGRYIIQRVHPNKCPFKILEKRELAWVYPGIVQCFKVPSQERVKAMYTDLKFCTHIHGID